MEVMNKCSKLEISAFDATMSGLGSIIGTGVFVCFGIAAGTSRPAVLIAIVLAGIGLAGSGLAGIGLAGIVATCNALSSRQLAAIHPASSGTCEYGYR